MKWFKEKLTWFLIAIGVLGIAYGQITPVGTLEQTLLALPMEKRAEFKGKEIEKVLTAGTFFAGSLYEIEIENFAARKDGIEIYARAWEKGNQLGFGDGTIEYERFVFVNPPILVPDPLGKITRTYTAEDGTIITKKYTIDPAVAIKIKLSRAIQRTGKSGENIIQGKRGDTTTVIDATHDATFNREDSNLEDDTWPNFVVKASENLRADYRGAGITGGNDSNLFRTWVRSGFTFDTSSIGTDDVTSVDFTAYANGAAEQTACGVANMNITDFNPANETSYVIADGTRSNFANTDWATDFAINTWVETDGTGNDITFNATGRSNINGSGNTVIGLRTDWDIDATFGGSWASNCSTDIGMYFQDDAGTVNDPELTIVHSAAATGNFLFGVGF